MDTRASGRIRASAPSAAATGRLAAGAALVEVAAAISAAVAAR
jgi:hypothetical protein